MTRAIRNIAIIAHVDHGKTTMVDRLLQCAGTFRDNQQVAERVMDSNDLERERGITILAKNCAVEYMGTHINIIDTPGHADFGGEVERVLSMVDGVLLLVDAVEGPMPQTRFVTRKALALGLKPIVVVNKIDRPGARPDWVINQTFDLFDKLGATEEQLDFPVIYASALNGYAGLTDDVEELKKIGDMRAVFDTVIKYVPVRDDNPDGPLQLQICSLDYSSYVGKIGVGRVHRGRIRPNMEVAIMNGPDDTPRRVKVNQILKFQGLDRQLVDEAEAGDIILVNGIEELAIDDHGPSAARSPADAQGRRTDPHDELPGEFVALGRPRREVRDEPTDPRTSRARTEVERRHARSSDGRRNRLGSRRPRRTPPHDSSRKHAPRRL